MGLTKKTVTHVCTQASCEGCAWPQCRCARGYYQCERGGCIPVDTMCDGTDNCADKSDEAHCELICWPGSSPCSDGLLCVADVHWCDGVQHCPTGSDEQCLAKGCPAPVRDGNKGMIYQHLMKNIYTGGIAAHELYTVETRMTTSHNSV